MTAEIPTTDPAVTPPSSASRKAPRLWWQVLLRAGLIFVFVPYVAVGGLMVVMQRKLIFVPTKTARLLASESATAEQPIDDIELAVANGITLHGWRFRPAKDTVSPSSRVVLYFPGNAGCRRDRLADCCDFTTLGCEVLLMDYRGYGENAGEPSEELFASDARRLWIYATQDLGYRPENTVLFGESLGGAVATRLAAEMSQAETPPAALIINSTFASMGDTVAWHYPAFPFRYLLFDRFPSIRRLPHVTCPVLQFHGTEDETVPLAHAQRLFASAPADAHGIAKRFVTLPGAGHNMVSVADMHQAMQELFDQLPQDKPRGN